MEVGDRNGELGLQHITTSSREDAKDYGEGRIWFKIPSLHCKSIRVLNMLGSNNSIELVKK